jgi:L-lactate dehydrogenase complex protein LldG
MTGAREEILGRLRGQPVEEGKKIPPPWQSRRDFPDLAARFEEALAAVKGEVKRLPDLPAALAEVGRQLASIDAKNIVVNGAPAPLTDVAWPEQFPEYRWHVVGQSAGVVRTFCAEADVGISSADAALAETGSLVVQSGRRRSRLATLLPPVHLALVPSERLTTDLFTWIDGRGEATFPANLVLISGPSKTADIEQTLSIGVHGPKRLVVILYDE